MDAHLTHMACTSRLTQRQHYGVLWRLAQERRIDSGEWERALTSSRSRRAAPSTARRGRGCLDGGFHSFVPRAHSLFVDTIRSLRALALVTRG